MIGSTCRTPPSRSLSEVRNRASRAHLAAGFRRVAVSRGLKVGLGRCRQVEE
jgi:hypothetical protein